MLILHILIFALVQGITEFLPVSSSGHLVLVHKFLGHDESKIWGDALLLDVAVHIGTLISVVIYFYPDLKNIVCSIVKSCLGGKLKNTSSKNTNIDGGKFFLFIIVSSLPVIICGLILHAYSPVWLRSTEVVAWMTLIFGIVLWVADVRFPTDKSVGDMNFMTALYIGLAQILALIPGTSRSGITMTAGRVLGFKRTEAARYSLLIGMVAISGAGILAGYSLVKDQMFDMTYDLLIAVALSAVAGWVSIFLMMEWLKRANFRIFGIYRIILGSILLGVIYLF